MPNLVERLLQPDAYPHPVGELSLHETHISWVILTGEFAYKIKKPVRFGFVDFSTLENRRRDCDRELALNDAMSPGLYLSVEPVREAGGGALRARFRRREHSVSDTDLAVLGRQLATAELPDDGELAAAGSPDGRDSRR